MRQDTPRLLRVHVSTYIRNQEVYSQSGDEPFSGWARAYVSTGSLTRLCANAQVVGEFTETVEELTLAHFHCMGDAKVTVCVSPFDSIFLFLSLAT